MSWGVFRRYFRRPPLVQRGLQAFTKRTTLISLDAGSLTLNGGALTAVKGYPAELNSGALSFNGGSITLTYARFLWPEESSGGGNWTEEASASAAWPEEPSLANTWTEESSL